MTEQEVIVVDQIPIEIYEDIVSKSVFYALLSLPFTVDRMGLGYSMERVKNIAKGKIAEKLFEFFSLNNGIPADFLTPSTPFYKIDNKDFILNSSEWDLKNNFLYHSGDLLNNFDYISLPALVPNRFASDQWGKKDIKYFPETIDSKFLFTFLKGASLKNGQRDIDFLDINVTSTQEQFIMDLYKKYHGLPQDEIPFAPELFWKEMSKRGGTNFFNLHDYPNLIITGYADSSHWSMFKDTGPYDRNLNFQTWFNHRWYTKTNSGAINFLSGTIWTKITNRTIPVSYLPSFLSLFPHMKDNLSYARLKS